MKKSFSIIGSTGSIGLTTLKVINRKRKDFYVNILVADKNFNLICSQIKKYKPNIFFINNFKVFERVKKKFKSSKTKILHTSDLKFKSIKSSEYTLTAIPGIIGLVSTLEMIKKTKKILIANKESIICGWKLLHKTARKYKTEIIPIDSEHFAIMKLLEKNNITDIKKIYLTASGGPFLNHKLSAIKNAGPKEALKHPKWKMGKKISIDSATLMNKILELIEAQKLFNIPQKKLEIVIHPQSLVHAIIELKNGLYKFIYHHNSMIIPIANAIFGDKLLIDEIYPEHYKKNVFLNNFSFQKVDKKKFPIIKIKNRLNEHKSTAIIINAVNETLVDLFLQKKVAFFDIFRTILRVLNDRNYKKYAVKDPKSINEIFLIDKWARDISIKKI